VDSNDNDMSTLEEVEKRGLEKLEDLSPSNFRFKSVSRGSGRVFTPADMDPISHIRTVAPAPLHPFQTVDQDADFDKLKNLNFSNLTAPKNENKDGDMNTHASSDSSADHYKEPETSDFQIGSNIDLGEELNFDSHRRVEGLVEQPGKLNTAQTADSHAGGSTAPVHTPKFVEVDKAAQASTVD